MSNLGIQFTAWPEMIAWPYLILKGWLPYRDIAIAHNPLLVIILAGFYKIAGVGIMQLKIFTWVLIAANSYLTYFVSKKFWNKKIAILSSILYLILCIIYQGNGLWFDLALTPFALLLYLFVREKKYLYAGIIFALGFLTKQTFIYFLIPVIFSKIDWKKFILGALPVAVVYGGVLLALGILDDYYNWAIKFGILYLPHAVGQVSFPSLKQFVFALSPFLVAVLSTEYIVLSFMIVGAFGTYPRWELFHLQPALPFLAIVISVFMFSKKSKAIKVFVGTFLVGFIFIGIYRNLGNNTRFFESDVLNVSSKTLELKYKNIYVVNYWDNVYALTNTIPATKPLIPYIPWYLNYQNSKETILIDLKVKVPEAIIIGERDIIFPELYEFVDRFYTCDIVEKRVELCKKN